MEQIEIYRRTHDEPVDMAAVCAALVDLMTDDQLDSYGRDVRYHEKVYVQHGCVLEAVKRINALGYHTDEDEPTDEDESTDESL